MGMGSVVKDKGGGGGSVDDNVGPLLGLVACAGDDGNDDEADKG
jgi:hypothetical protein